MQHNNPSITLSAVGAGPGPSNSPSTLPILRLTLEMISEHFANAKKFTSPLKSSEIDTALVRQVAELFNQEFKKGTKESDILSVDFHFELAKILLQVNKDVVGTRSRVLLHSLVNAFGSMILRAFKGFTELTKDDFIAICMAAQQRPSLSVPVERKVVSQEKKSPAPLVRPWPRAPRQVALEDLTERGFLDFTHEGEVAMLARKAAASENKEAAVSRDGDGVSGRITKKQIEVCYGTKSKYSADWWLNEEKEVQLCWVYKGEKHQPPDRQLATDFINFNRGGAQKGEVTPSELGEAPLSPCGVKFTKNLAGYNLTWVFPHKDYKEDPKIDERGQGKLVGAGRFGRVKVGILHRSQKLSPQWCVIKQIDRKEVNSLEFEIGSLQETSLGFVCRYSPSKKRDQVENVQRWLPGTTLAETLQTKTKLNPVIKMHLCLSILDAALKFSALKLYKNRRVVHGDLSPRNIMVDGCDAAIFDFGNAKALLPHETSIAVSDKNITGTPGFISAAVWRSGVYSAKSDEYSLGMILAVLQNLIVENEALEALSSEDGFQQYMDKYKSLPTMELRSDDCDEMGEESKGVVKGHKQVLGCLRKMVDEKETSWDLRKSHSFFKSQVEDFKKRPLNVCLLNINEFMRRMEEPRFVDTFLKVMATERIDIVQGVEFERSPHATPKRYIQAHRILDDNLKIMLGRHLINWADKPLKKFKNYVDLTEWGSLSNHFNFIFWEQGLRLSPEVAKEFNIRVVPFVRVRTDSTGYTSLGAPGTPGRKGS